MDNKFALTFPSGSVESSIQTVTLVNNTAKTLTYTVTDDTMVVIQTISVTNPDDVARTVTITLWNESAKTNRLAILEQDSVGASGIMHYPNLETAGGGSTGFIRNAGFPLLLKAGMTIEVVWAAGGASSGGTDADGFAILLRKLLLT